jgi:prepilin-type N-terminal cleavage/methylation domain-containing protein
MDKNNKNRRGFTLLELLIVIGIIAILSVVLVLVLNPAETLKKSRDVQRMSDMATMKTAIGLLVTSSSTPYLAQTSTNCLQDSGSAAQIFYSFDTSAMTCSGSPTAGTEAAGTFTQAGDFCTNVTTGSAAVDGTGWLAINFNKLPGGSPISSLPLDPTNTIASPSAPANSDLVYRYACQSTSTSKPNYVFEMNAKLESSAYTVDDNRMTKDGGDSTNFYEVGTNLKLLPTTGM